jgi:hypothetical protein
VNVLLTKFDVSLPPFLKLIIYLNFYFILFLLRIFIIYIMTTHMHRTNKSDFRLVIWVVNQHVRKIIYLICLYNDIPITFFLSSLIMLRIFILCI